MAKDATENVIDGVKQATVKLPKVTETLQKKSSLRQLLSHRSSSKLAEPASSEGSTSEIVVQHDENSKSLSADLRNADTVVGEAHKRWEDLEAHERETWKRRLIDAGEWAVEEGEAVLKGLFFQNIALAVGAAVEHGMG